MPMPPRAPETETATPTGATSALAGGATTPSLQAAPSHQFLYVLYPGDPGNWFVATVDGESVWLPKLQKHALMPGVGGVRTLNKGEPAEAAYSEAIRKIERRGGVVLDRDLDYCYGTPCTHPRTRATGKRWHDQFETPYVPQGRSTVVKFRTDVESRNAWLLDLVRLGHLPPPDPSVIDANVLRLDARIYERASRRNIQLPADMPEVAAAKAAKMPATITDAMEDRDRAASAKVPEGPPPVAKPTPRARRKVEAAKAPAKPRAATRTSARAKKVEEGPSDG